LHHLPLINSWEDVLDKGITEGTTNWQMYGSRKPGNEAYELTGVFWCEIKYCNEYGTPYLHPVVEIEDCLAKLKSHYIQTGDNNYLDYLSIQNDYDTCECKVSADSIRLKNSTQKRTFREISATAAVEMGDGLTMEEELLYISELTPKIDQSGNGFALASSTTT
jgi:hypothetical protein